MSGLSLPDEYQALGVPFTRSTRPKATITNATHSLQKHSYGSPLIDEVSYFPKGFFGAHDNDVFEVMRKMDLVTYLADPIWNARTNSWMFEAELDGVRAVVPVQMAQDGSGWEVRTMWPDGGPGVQTYRRGRLFDVA